MKTTLDIPDALLRTAKMQAARDGTTLRAVVTRALEAEVGRGDVDASRAVWRKHFGALRRLRPESAGISAAIDDAFEQIDEDAWQ